MAKHIKYDKTVGIISLRQPDSHDIMSIKSVQCLFYNKGGVAGGKREDGKADK